MTSTGESGTSKDVGRTEIQRSGRTFRRASNGSTYSNKRAKLEAAKNKKF